MNTRRQMIQFQRTLHGVLLTAVIGSSGVLAQEWVPLDGSLIGETGGLVRPSLVADPGANPILGFDRFESGTTSVARWRGGAWETFGPDIAGTSGPSIGLDAEKRVYLCHSGKYAGTGALNVLRWKGNTWRQIGGDVAKEAGYSTGLRHVVDACGGVALDRSSNPIVTWEALVGAKTWAVFAARWDGDQNRWKGLGEAAVTAGRGVTTYLDVDANDRPYLATTNTVGAGRARVTTTQVWRWNGRQWVQLGTDLLGAEDTVMGVYENAPYLTTHYVDRDPDTGDIRTDELRVMRWRQGSWQAFPSPGHTVGRSALDFTPSGKPVVAYLESLDEGQTLNLRVKYWTGKAWRSVGDAVVSLSCGPACYPEALLDLSLDRQGRPIVAWGERNYVLLPDGTYGPVHRLTVKRYSGSLPDN